LAATGDFVSPLALRHARRVLPKPDEIRYRFGDASVVIRPEGGDQNRLSAAVE
jgi:hypothetical protein